MTEFELASILDKSTAFGELSYGLFSVLSDSESESDDEELFSEISKISFFLTD